MSLDPYAEAARRCREALLAGGQADGQDVAMLAAGGESPEAARAVFKGVVEPLADLFEPRLVGSYVAFFAGLLDRVRGLAGFAELDARLTAVGLSAVDDIVGRFENIQRERTFDGDAARVRKVFVLSRITIGADVAVTSPVLRAAIKAFPQAEVSFVGGAKSARLFAGETALRHLSFEYPRSGGLAERLGAWLRLADAIEAQSSGLAPEQTLIIDPDSRLTQLGLLPLGLADSAYLFFDSRAAGGDGGAPLASLASEWARRTLKTANAPKPFISLLDEDRAEGEGLRRQASGRLAAVNLGVGGNVAKRAADPFETDLVKMLLARGWTVALDRGFGDEEYRRTDVIRRVADNPRLLAHEGSIASFAGVIAASDLYVGYDSAASHIAAALGVRGVDVFVGAASPRMRSRWSPWGARPAAVVAVEPGEESASVLARVREALE